MLRQVYNSLLGPQQSASLRKYQDYESVTMMHDLLESPQEFLAHTERFATSVIFSAVYGVPTRSARPPDYVQVLRCLGGHAEVYDTFFSVTI